MAKSRGSSGRRPSRGLLFPLSLAGLVLLALPGAGLLLVSLLGQETQANDWLRSHLGLGYHNPLPFLPSLFLLLLPLVLLLLYFLRLRRPPLLVPSTLLWRKSIDDLRVNSLFQWLRDHFLLLIQLGVVLLLLHSILAIQIHGQTAHEGSHFIVLIDSSASMAATDVGPSRLEKARQLALELIDSRPDGDTGMIIEFNSQATIRQPYTSEKSLLRSAVRSIGQTQRPTRLDEALTLADGLANPHRSMEDESVRPPGEDPAEARTYVAPEGRHAEVHLFSDGRFPDVPGFAAGNLGLVYHPVGASPEQVRNVGIVNLSLSRESDRSGQETRRRLVFVRLLSDLPAGEDVTVELEWRQPGQGEFRLLEQVVRLPGRSADPTSASKEEKLTELPGEATATFALGDIEESTTLLFHARLRNHRDQLALDDEAWMVAGPARRARVLIVSPGNEILRNFFDLEETRRFADVSYLTPESLGDASRYLQPARSGAFDLVIFDRCAPAKEDDLPAGNTFFIAEVPPPWKRGDMPAVPARSLLRPRSDHSLMRGLTGLDEIAFSEAFRFDLSEARVPPRIPRLLEAEGETALLFLLPRRSYQDLVLTFPLVNARGQWTTDWNLRLSFPLFLRNVLFEMGHVMDADREPAHRPGEIEVIRPESAPERIEVRDPRGSVFRVDRGAGGSYAFAQTERVGVYQASWPGGDHPFAINLCDEEESRLKPREAIRIGEQRIAAEQRRWTSTDTWKWICLAALTLLVLEWAAYTRTSWKRWWYNGEAAPSRGRAPR